ncbi:glycosyltransferase family 2 protein [Cumulibacter manganitolerans]|uniref:glycosyltransferase family 2 protein n=1 Tax=Cumulibacter manganitolerans TaxID=1884992 RepID=UPI0018864E81|nr:glycosyltransferase [Cumulibacter manganitolerans]
MSTLPQAKVAVITRTKNRPVLLRRALDSVLAQSFEDYVLVVVNDAGDRGPVEQCVAEVSERARGRIHVVHNERSAGREAAMNVGLRNSESAYVVVHDDDDTWAPEFLTRTVAHLEATPDDGGVAVRTEVVYETVEGERITTDRREILASNMTDVTLFEMIRRNYAPPISLLYRRAVHDTVGGYAEDLPVLADWDFNLRMLQHYHVGFIDGPPLAFWHQRENAEGDLGNSVIAAAQDHTSFDRTIRDRYLREDVREHDHLGTLLYLTELIDRGDQLTRIRHDQNLSLLHNINNQVAQLTNDTDSRMHEANQLIREQNTALAELNRNLVSQNNRIVAQFEQLTQRVVELEELVFAQTPRERLKSWKALARRKADALGRRLR